MRCYRGSVRRAAVLLIASALVTLSACGPTGAISDNGEATLPPMSSDRLVITTPDDQTIVTEPDLIVTGIAPVGADVVREVRFGRDDHATATGGRWSMHVELDEGDNLLTFRIGDEEATSATLLVTLESDTRAAESPNSEPTDEPKETSWPQEADSSPDSLAVKVAKRTTSVPRNGTASVSIKTTEGATCDIEVIYNSGPSTAAGLGTKKANSSGAVTWKWKVGGRTAKGTYPIHITCIKGDRNGSADTTFRVR